MATLCSESKTTCTAAAFVVSLVIGIITAFLRLTAAITVTPAFLWVSLGVGLVYLVITLIAAAIIYGSGSCRNFCSSLTALITGIVGTILFSIILLAIEFVATSIIGAIITGILLFFFFLTVTSTACFVRCLITDRD